MNYLWSSLLTWIHKLGTLDLFYVRSCHQMGLSTPKLQFIALIAVFMSASYETANLALIIAHLPTFQCPHLRIIKTHHFFDEVLY